MILSPFIFSTPSWDEDLLRNESLMKTRCIKQSYDTFHWICVWIWTQFCSAAPKTRPTTATKKKTRTLLLKKNCNRNCWWNWASRAHILHSMEICASARVSSRDLFALLGATDLETSQNHILMTCMHYIAYCRLAKLIQFFVVRCCCVRWCVCHFLLVVILRFITKCNLVSYCLQIDL